MQNNCSPGITMPKKGWIAFFLGLSLSCLVVRGQDFPLNFSHIRVDDGLSHTDVKDIKQDKNGFIWIGTLFGLDRYDGYVVKRFYNTTNPLHNAFKNRIRSIYPAEDGKIWLATDDGIQCFDSRTEQFLHLKIGGSQRSDDQAYIDILKLPGNKLLTLWFNKIVAYKIEGLQLIEISVDTPKHVNFNHIAADPFGNVWLAANNAVWLIDSNNHLRRYNVVDASMMQKPHEPYSRIYFNRVGEILLVSGKRILQSSSTVGSIASGKEGNSIKISKQINLPGSSYIYDIIQDKHGNYWMSTDIGLILASPNFQHLEVINKKSTANGLSTNTINKLFIDRSECLWIGTFGGGVDFFDLNAKLFHTFQHNPELSNTLSGNHIRSILEEADGNVWIGTNANGLNHYDYRSRKFSFYSKNSGKVKLKSDQINAVALDNRNNLWIGSDKGIEILGSDRKKIEHPEGWLDFPQYSIENLAIDFYGNIWFTSYNKGIGCIKAKKPKGYCVHYFGSGHFIYADSIRPELLVATTNGLDQLILDSNSNIRQTFHYQSKGNPNSLSSNYLWPIQRENDSVLWIGTIGGGLNRVVLKADGEYFSTQYGNREGVFSDVESLQIDGKGNIWMGGNGLEVLNTTKKTLVKYNKNDGLQGNSFKVGSSYLGRGGRMYFGGINGLNYFYPDSIKSNNIPAMPVLTDLKVNNEFVAAGPPNSAKCALPEMISYASELSLNHAQNNFEISFSSMHYANAVKCRYRYKLEGFDKSWKYSDGSNNKAFYINLDYGDYRFVVQATNNDILWSPNQASVIIHMLPPWYKSNWAKLGYLVIFLSFLAGIYFIQARWLNLKRDFEVRALEERKRRELQDMQLQFFTNISHEFRTPLTLLLGPLENIVKENPRASVNHYYQVIYRNAKRLMSLVTELMNFRKVADNAIQLHVIPVDLCQFINDLSDEFRDLARDKEIVFEVVRPGLPLKNWFDVQILEKILFNLLNNSFKYTPNGGSVSLEIFSDPGQLDPLYENEFSLLNDYRAKQYVYFRIADSGIGISKESIGQIFDRYYRISDAHLGSGVGLALVKSLTIMHKGDIYVNSERHKGTEITIGIPLGEENYRQEEKCPGTKGYPEVQLERIDTFPESTILPENQETTGTPILPLYPQSILIVEDNEELRNFLQLSLKQYYHILQASDGQSAFEMAKQETPDLIISDLMMPVMNGIELCRSLKENFETSHITFIILSARESLEAKLESIGSGADFYFAKPLSVELLLITIHNIFDQKQKLKDRYLKDYFAEATQLVQSDKDKGFMEELLQLIESNMASPDMDVEFICHHLFISRTKLYQKIKSVSGQSVGEFIRTVRLKKAAHILTHEDVPVTEVMFRVGIQSSSYFSRSFKKEFGKSPSLFLQSIRRNH